MMTSCNRSFVGRSGLARSIDLMRPGLERAADGPDAARVGDWVLVHVGFAMSKIEEAEAKETLDALKALGDMYEQELTDYSAEIEGLADSTAPVAAAKPW